MKTRRGTCSNLEDAIVRNRNHTALNNYFNNSSNNNRPVKVFIDEPKPITKIFTAVDVPSLSGKFLKNKCILIAEDDKIIRLLLSRLLKPTGAILKFATDGRDALDYFKVNTHVDLVLLDICMPKMNGMEALTQMRKVNPDAKIIMQTAHADRIIELECIEKGSVDFISKPIIKEELYHKLNKWVHYTP